jgi:hypothetical protein
VGRSHADLQPVAPWDWRTARREKTNVRSGDIKVVPNGVKIVALLPNPQGTDAGNEQVTIANSTNKSVTLQDWKLIDKAGNGVRQLDGLGLRCYLPPSSQ